MSNNGSSIFLIFFAVSVAVAYIVVRRQWAKSAFVGGVSVVLNALFIFLYSLSEGAPLFSALGTGIVVSLIFTALAVSISTYFRVNSLRAGVSPAAIQTDQGTAESDMSLSEPSER